MTNPNLAPNEDSNFGCWNTGSESPLVPLGHIQQTRLLAHGHSRRVAEVVSALAWLGGGTQRFSLVQMLDGSFSAPATSHLSLRGARFIRSVISVSVNSVEASLTIASGHVCCMILLLSSLAPTIAYALGFTLSLANACRTPPGVVPTSMKPISSPRKLWPSCNAAKASKPLVSRDEVRQTPSPAGDASLATTKGLVKSLGEAPCISCDLWIDVRSCGRLFFLQSDTSVSCRWTTKCMLFSLQSSSHMMLQQLKRAGFAAQKVRKCG